MPQQSEFANLVEKYCADNYEPLPVVISRGDGVFVWDTDGKKYIDMLSSYSALSHGYRNPKILAALFAQCEKVTLTSRAFHNDIIGPFLKLLCETTGFEKTLPMNTGAEAVETGLKAVRKWAYEVKGVPDGKARIIAAKGNFHGRTIAAISLSSKKKTRAGFGPLVENIDIIPFNDADALEAAITPDTACFIVEPIQGEGGVIVPDDGYLPRVREICDRNNVLLCCDEVQTGFARTGKMFCFEHYGIRPDALLLGKALGGGVYPVSAFCADKRVMDVFTPGTHGSTFGGNPLACAVGIAAIKTMVEDDYAGRAREQGEYLMDRLRGLNLPGVVDVRGKGLLIGVDYGGPVAHEKSLKLMKAGVLCRDTNDSTLRFAPPLTITKDEIDGAIDIIGSTLRS